MIPLLSEDLYGEILSYLCDDIPSLKAASLANPIMTMAAQKLLFSSVALHARKNLLRPALIHHEDDFSGTSADFEQLLARRPCIASYVRSIHIIDLSYHYEGYEEDSVVNDGPVESDVGKKINGYHLSPGVLMPSIPGDYASGVHRWLPTDISLPLCAPMLCNLKSLNISYDGGWHFLSSRILRSLIDLMQRPSLVHVRVGEHIPSSIFNLALAPNIRHLVLPGLETDDDAEDTQFLIDYSNQPTAPVCLESLYTNRPSTFLALLASPKSRVSMSNLRKLVVLSQSTDEHLSISFLLQFCYDTLEDLEISPTHYGMFLIPISEAEVVY